MSKGEAMANYIYKIQCGGDVQRLGDKYGDYDFVVQSCESWYTLHGRSWVAISTLVAEYHRHCGAGW